MAISVEVFDSRLNQLGEGPTSSGAGNNDVAWVDIYGRVVRSKNLITGKIGEYKLPKMLVFKFQYARAEIF